VNIIYIVSTLKNSGPINILFNIVKYIDFNKNYVSIITLSPEPLNSRIQEFKDLGIKILPINLSRISGIFLLRNEVNKIINKLNPDIIHSHGLRSDSISIALSKKYNIVSTVHNFPFIDYPMKFGNLKGKLMATKHFSVIKKFKYAIACSKSIAAEFRNQKKITLKSIQNGVETDVFFFESDKGNKIKLKKRLKLPLDKKIFISVGSIIPRKDMKTILKTFLNSSIDRNLFLIIAGDGLGLNELKSISKNKVNILLLGNIDNVKEYLQASDYFISASHAEGLPNTVLEAMSCGLPSILSDIPSHNEITKYDESCEMLFKKNNIKELSNKINEVLKINYNTLSLNSRKLIEKNLSARIMSKKYQELYLNIINGVK